MERDEKSPFRLWLESDIGDSQSSFNLPSPRLVERAESLSPNHLFYEVEEPTEPIFAKSSFNATSDSMRLTQTLAGSERKIYMKTPVPCPLLQPRGRYISPLRLELAATGLKTSAKRSWTPSHPTRTQLLLKQGLNVSVRKPHCEGEAGLRLVSGTVKTCGKNFELHCSTRIFASPRLARSRPSESPRNFLRAGKETPGLPYRTFLSPRKLIDSVARVSTLRGKGLQIGLASGRTFKTPFQRPGQVQAPERKTVRRGEFAHFCV